MLRKEYDHIGSTNLSNLIMNEYKYVGYTFLMEFEGLINLLLKVKFYSVIKIFETMSFFAGKIKNMV